jgi:phosphatidylserine decarboxylase
LTGHLFSVSPLAAQLFRDLFVLNERVVLAGRWQVTILCFGMLNLRWFRDDFR